MWATAHAPTRNAKEPPQAALRAMTATVPDWVLGYAHSLGLRQVSPRKRGYRQRESTSPQPRRACYKTVPDEEPLLPRSTRVRPIGAGGLRQEV